MDPLFVRPREAMKILSVSEGKVYAMIKSGELRSKKIGGTRLIPVSALKELAEWR
jgi:excisionase family DNA binding protein